MRKRLARVKVLAVAAGLLWIAPACGYSSAVRVQEARDWMMIPVFENQTFEPALEGKLTRRVKQEFIRRGGFRITEDPGRARYILEGQITSFDLAALSFNTASRAVEQRVRISTNVEVLSATDRTVLRRAGGIQGTAEFVVDPDPGVSRSAQDLAIEEALARAAEEIWIELTQGDLTD